MPTTHSFSSLDEQNIGPELLECSPLKQKTRHHSGFFQYFKKLA